jgi:hypothetical protein
VPPTPTPTPTATPKPTPTPTATPKPTATPQICTFTQGGWGAACNGNNVGCTRDAGFASAFPSGLRIGDLSGPNGPTNGFTALFTSSAAIEAYLPDGGPSGALTADLTDPTSTPAGALGGQLVAAKLNVGIAGTPTNLVYVDCVVDELNGLTVAQVISLADTAVASGTLPAGVAFSDLTDALDALNSNFDECKQNNGCFAQN